MVYTEIVQLEKETIEKIEKLCTKQQPNTLAYTIPITNITFTNGYQIILFCCNVQQNKPAKHTEGWSEAILKNKAGHTVANTYSDSPFDKVWCIDYSSNTYKIIIKQRKENSKC